MPDTKKYLDCFITPEEFEKLSYKNLSGPNGWLLFVACNSGIDFAQNVKIEYEKILDLKQSSLRQIPLIGTHEQPLTTVFADTETCPRLPKYVAGSNAFVFQCVQENVTGNTVNENIQQLMQVVRTLRAHRAKTISVVTPYSPYSRQDKPTFMKREATLASLFADQLKISGADIHMTYHPHAYSLYGFYEPDMMFVAISGLDLFIDIFSKFRGMENTVAVSTDAGGAKFTIHYADAMNITYAIANKYRKAKDKSHLLGIIGDVEDKKIAIITDDETVTGNSIINATEQLYSIYGVKEIHVAISHLKMKKEFLPALIHAHNEWGLKEIHVTDTIPQIPEIASLDFIKVHSLARRFAYNINRLHYNQSLSMLSYDQRNWANM